LLMSHTYVFVIDHLKQELEKLQEPALAEEANPEQDRGKPRYI
jgi:hypothetical protein